ncbi:IPExxxVDY family protein [Flavicella marina]|uniref:IPExxxVDY family protein n=1 Tax=Flavicella marina TaxID=1475951 RepID=UPI0012654AB4|nr:IPExxxVDY family protein [Flavicella marina]
MQIHSLEIDDFEDSNFTLISIHTSLPDYKLAYLLNKSLQTSFTKSKDSLIVEDKSQKACFSVFSYQDESQDVDWYLIENKYHGTSTTPIENGLFGLINETVNRTSYLIPEKKNTDYLVKIEGDYAPYLVHDTIGAINKMEQVMTSYKIDITTLKSKDFLII